MNNRRIINLTIKFKDRIRHEIEENQFHSEEMKAMLWNMLVMAEIAHRSFGLGIKIEAFEKQYFNRQAAVGRHFGDWAMDWVAENYFEISNYIASHYWTDNDKAGFDRDYTPFKTFNLEGK